MRLLRPQTRALLEPFSVLAVCILCLAACSESDNDSSPSSAAADSAEANGRRNRAFAMQQTEALAERVCGAVPSSILARSLGGADFPKTDTSPNAIGLGYARDVDISPIPLQRAAAEGCRAGVRSQQDDAPRSEASEPTGATVTPSREVLQRSPYMGLACPTPNSFACDRVGLAVWLRDPAAEVHAAIADQDFDLRVPKHYGGRQQTYFTGYLQPAGLVNGPLQIEPDASGDRWIGRDPVSAPVRLEIVHGGGEITVTEVEVDLFGGFG